MLGFLALIGALWVAPACETAFCSCVPRSAVRTEFDSADAVFTGRVLSVRDTTVDPASGHGGWRMRRVVLRADRAWKGVESDTVVVVTGMSDGDCGFRFRRGATYLVFAHAAPDGSLGTGICDRTARLWRAAADVRALGEPARRWRR